MDVLQPGRGGRGKPINRDGWPPPGVQRDWLAYCDKVHRENGLPSLRKLGREMPLAATRVGELLRGEALPADKEQAQALLAALGATGGGIRLYEAARAGRDRAAQAAGPPGWWDQPGYQGSRALLVQYIAQGRAGTSRPRLSARSAARLLLIRPARLTGGQQEALAGITTACPEMTALAGLARSFAALLAPGPRNERLLKKWITTARAASLPHPHSFTRGLDLDSHAATAALTPRTTTPAPKESTTKPSCPNARCTDAQGPPSSAIASSSADATNRHHRICDRTITGTHRVTRLSVSPPGIGSA